MHSNNEKVEDDDDFGDFDGSAPSFDFTDKFVIDGALDDAPTEVQQVDAARETTKINPVVSAPPLANQAPDRDIATTESDKVISAFEKYMERSATANERTRLLKTMADLGIRANDAHWLATFQFESYNALFNVVPDKIAAEVKNCVETIKEFNDAEIKRANLEIQRREREIDHDINKAEYALSNQISILFDKLIDDQKVAIEKEVERKYNLRKWSLFSLFAFLQMAIIISTNATVYFLATGTTALPWFETGQGSTVSSWIFQALWNFPSGWVMSFLAVFSGIFYIWYDNFKKM